MRIFRRAGLILLLIAVMTIVSYGTYRVYMGLVGNRERKEYEQREQQRSRQVEQVNENVITPKTTLKVENYNRKENSIVEENVSMPADYIGLDRQALLSSLEEYEADPSIDDLQMGFENCQIISFSDKQVVLRKTYMPPNVVYQYYLSPRDGCVAVYYIDKKTVFEYTNIPMESLPEDVKKQIEKGKYVTDTDSLYDFLENYSS